jgi:hypothetical protein
MEVPILRGTLASYVSADYFSIPSYFALKLAYLGTITFCLPYTVYYKVSRWELRPLVIKATKMPDYGQQKRQTF